MASDDTTGAGLAAARDLLLQQGDLVGVARCERAKGWLTWGSLRASETHTTYRRAYELLRQAGRRAWNRDLLQWLQLSAAFGRVPLDEVLGLLGRFEEEVGDGGPMIAAALGSARARSLYAAGRIDAAAVRAAMDTETELLRQTGSELTALDVEHFWSLVLWLEGDREGLEAQLRKEVVELERAGRHLYLANVLGQWALALCDLGQPSAALDAVERGRGIAVPDDIADQIQLDLAEAYARALLGDLSAARELLGRAGDRARDIDTRFIENEIERVRADVHRLAGELDAAAATLSRLADDAEALGFHRFAARYRRDLEALASAARD
jgi:hypothetical protein